MSLNNERLIPKYVSAPNARMLRRAMLKNNRRHGKAFNYFTILKDGRNFVAWYYDIEDDPQLINEVDQEIVREVVTDAD